MNQLRQKQFAQKYASNYVETSVSEATPHKLVQMLYEGVIRHLKVSKVFMEQKNYEKKAFHLNKSLSIINGLKTGVDIENAGDVAANIYELYDYCYRTVFSASRDNDLSKIDEILTIFSDLDESWKQMPSEIKQATRSKIKTLAHQ
ncbi:flagellar export chaperone FliS [Thiomicrorhabdus lithotrophica]|uniref:Flagellar secretion chaperone FliS n=1 Tax=Thiomicrorhabdus lithotrophica TaxID=2949997 RepID=A0ABY8CFZ9_9GAMM|nr:flagellar export chaperone FliS [Thiomicrorhabdus lithotrophica]WEJ63373.1 flagellar export chaperone FliS [Thiomicrorhabdus lithotrophica]